MPAGGRQPELQKDPERRALFLEKIGLGMSVAKACGAVRIRESTYYNYVQKANDEKNKNSFYMEFMEDVKKAESTFAERASRVIHKAAVGHDVTTTKTVVKELAGGGKITETTTTMHREYHWQAAAWLLERRLPDEYGRRFDLDGNEATEVRIIVTPVAGPGHTPKPNGGTNGNGKSKSNGKAKGNGKAKKPKKKEDE